ncbi:P-loop containing nucleoside triphosphate hydrolase protein, partial [Myxozyma melibiosi]
MQNSRTQVNLFGRAVGVAAGITARQTNAFVTRAPRPFEPLYLESRPQRSHHTLVHDSLKTWVYPTNVAVRDYQRNIAERAILTNTLVALPTGLGKTLIAAVVMLNYYRWTKDSKIVFMAPTRPLVTQQAEACYKIAGIPRDDTALFVGSAASPAVREQIWNEKRVFFTTPQILDNDLKRGTVDPKKVVCLVIDEAHRAAGAYSYVNVVQFIKRFSEEVRILALSATPGSSVEAVQNVIKNLSISHAEIRTELSDDVKGFVRGSKVEHYSAELTEEGFAVLNNFGQVLQPMLTELNNANVYFVRDPEKISLYGLVLARGDFQKQYGMRGMNNGYKWKIESTFNLITPLAHALGLLKNHGIKPFYEYISNWEKAQRYSDTGKAKKPGKGATSVLNNPHYKRMMQLAQKAIDQGAVSHEKINLLVAKLVEFFTDEEVVADRSKVIVFCEYRSSASELLRVLSEVESVKPHLFIGQSSAKDQSNIEAGQGMSQKEQQKVLDDFKAGIYNTLIATSIGEEGLDIGQVDMIICYDASSSPVRVLQRMGRTGRFRKGKIIAILTENERQRFDQALQKYEEIQRSISDISNFEFVPCSRILPDDVTPEIDLRTIDIPPENEEEPTIATTSSVKKRTRKAPAKKFNMPDDVETSFTSAASLLDTSKKRSRAKANQ